MISRTVTFSPDGAAHLDRLGDPLNVGAVAREVGEGDASVRDGSFDTAAFSFDGSKAALSCAIDRGSWPAG